MKIGSSQPNPGSAPVERSKQDAAPRSGEKREDEGGKRFGSALEKKVSERKQSGADAAQGDPAAMGLGAMPMLPREGFVAATESTGVRATATVMPPEIAALSGEVMHAIESAGPNEVRIQFDARVLDGLSVTLTKEGGALQVSLQTNSLETARFLEQHAASLAQSLERPERAAFIQVEARSQGTYDPREGRQGGRQQERDDRGQDGHASGDEQ